MAERDAAAHMLAQLLDQERAALLSGDLTRLADLAPRKAEAAGVLTSSGKAITRDLLTAAHRNNVLLVAAAEGVRAALHRLSDVRTAVSGRTYGPDGRLRGTSAPATSRRL